jgi:hypothetical protein
MQYTERIGVRGRIFSAAIVTGAGVLALILFIGNPEGRASIIPPCPLYFFTRIFCPGCGTARAMHQLLHGHLLSALAYNPLTVLFAPLLLYVLCSHILIIVRGRGLSEPNLPARGIWALFGLILIYWILRNIPVYPFALLAPHSL